MFVVLTQEILVLHTFQGSFFDAGYSPKSNDHATTYSGVIARHAASDQSKLYERVGGDLGVVPGSVPSLWNRLFVPALCPLLAGTLGPLAKEFCICSIATGWRHTVV